MGRAVQPQRRPLGWSHARIADEVGTSTARVHEILLPPDKHAAYLARRREHWQTYAARRRLHAVEDQSA